MSLTVSSTFTLPYLVDQNSQELTLLRDEVVELRCKLKIIESQFESGEAVKFNDYSYIPKTRSWIGSPVHNKILHMIEERRVECSHFVETICSYNPYFRDIPVIRSSNTDPLAPIWENWWLPGFDAATIYALLASTKPRRYFEIGSGNSTRFARRAIKDWGLDTKITSIDPHPTTDVDELCNRVVRSRCEDVSVEIFAELEAGDVLFIDNSHRSFQGSDVTVFFTEILPRLSFGVTYGVHDIFLPSDYPREWLSRFYNEQYLFMSYLLGGAGGDTLLFPTHYVANSPIFATQRFPLYVGANHINTLASSFWMTRGG